MNKSLQILFGLLLILVLAYVAFLDVSSKIKDDLLSKTQTVFSKNNVKKVTVNLKGEGLEMSRSLVLAGTAISDIERVRIVKLTENIEGVCRIDNQITLYPVVPKAPKVPTAIKVPVVKALAKPIVTKSTPKEIILTKSTVETVVEKEESITAESFTATITKVPVVPVIKNNTIVVPTPVKAIDAPKVIEVEKIKLEGVK